MLRNIVFFVLSALIVSCVPNHNPPGVPDCSVHFTTSTLKDPYSQPGTNSKNPTHEYVRFHIYNSQEFKDLEEQGIRLLDHSFDAVPDNNLNYKTENTRDYAVFYGVVPNGFNLSAYHAEKIRDVYMPASSATSRVNNNTDKQFSGQVTFFDPVDSVMVPLKGVQVQIKSGTVIVSTISDGAGNFSITTPLIVADTVEVLLKFDNDYLQIHTLSLNDIMGVVGINTYSLGFRQACAFSDLQLKVDNTVNSAALHHSCAMLLTLNEYKDFTAHYGFMFPNTKLLMWLGRNAVVSTSYATPMLQNMSQQNISNPAQLLENLFGFPADQAVALADKLKGQLPDVYAPFYDQYNRYARRSFIEVLFHEFSHAVHYAKVGPDFWLPYVEYIVQNGGYGYDSLPNSGIISLSEAWAEDLSKIGLNYTYGIQSYLDQEENKPNYWIPYGLYYDLYDSGTNESFDHVSGITFPDIYSLFSIDTKSPADLKAKLKLAYPAQSDAIDELFAHYGR